MGRGADRHPGAVELPVAQAGQERSGLEPGLALVQLAADPPEPPQRPAIRISRSVSPVSRLPGQGGTQILPVRRHPGDPERLGATGPQRAGRGLGEVGVVDRVPAPQPRATCGGALAPASAGRPGTGTGRATGPRSRRARAGGYGRPPARSPAAAPLRPNVVRSSAPNPSRRLMVSCRGLNPGRFWVARCSVAGPTPVRCRSANLLKSSSRNSLALGSVPDGARDGRHDHPAHDSRATVAAIFTSGGSRCTVGSPGRYSRCASCPAPTGRLLPRRGGVAVPVSGPGRRGRVPPG